MPVLRIDILTALILDITSAFYYGPDVVIEEYEKYLIISRPDHRRDDGIWLTSATVTWHDKGGFHYHQFSDMDEIFDSEQEALAFGFTIARAWIDKRL